jgi:transaldolase
MSTIEGLHECGQSVWLDFLDRKLIDSGDLDTMVAVGGLRGLTSNPTIFQKAIATSNAYDDLVGSAPRDEPEASVLERLMVRDIRAACDRLLPVYERTEGADGFASIEVSPLAAYDTERSVLEAHRLWEAVARPNVMVKIPGTVEGLPAIERCLAEGININITLLFSVSRYLDVVLAYMSALETRLAERKPVDRIASVASFFVSRVDAKVDKALDALDPSSATRAKGLRGQIAIANSKLAYAEYERITGSDRWRALATRGARPQRLLWASTSPKDPAYPDTYYADALVGPDTVDTMTLECMRGYLDHGHPEVRLTKGLPLARQEMTSLGAFGIDLPAIERDLEREGVAAFSESFRRALEAIGERRRRLSAA